MKKRSIRHWIILVFSAIFVLTMLFSAVLQYRKAISGVVNNGTEKAEALSRIVTNLVRHQWGGLDTLSQSAESDLYLQAKRTLRNLCKAFQMDWLCIYRLDPEMKTRYYYMIIALDPQEESDFQAKAELRSLPVVHVEPQEEALMAGERQIQQEFYKTSLGLGILWSAPYLDENDSMAAIIEINYTGEQLRQELWKQFWTGIIPIGLIFLLGSMAFLLMVQHRIIRPIRVISDSMNRFVQKGSHQPEALGIRSKDEIGEIATSYEKLTADISAYINNLEALTRKQVENDVQLELAHRIQSGLVPEKVALDGKGFRATAMSRPAKAVGGDFYDCFQRDDGSVCILMGDVSGKGITAAIFMAMIKTILREKLMNGLSPAETLNQTNDRICAQNPENLFTTVFAAILNPLTGELRYANAGHTHPALLGNEPVLLKPEAGIALGMFEDAGLKDYTVLLAPSEGILLYTDGVTEAINPRNQFFGEDRLMRALNGLPAGVDAEDILLRVSRAVCDFCDGSEPFDDMAVLALLRTPPKHGWVPLPVSLSSFEEVKKAVFMTAGETPETRRALLACDEALSNIVNYSGAKFLAFLCNAQGDELLVHFSDDGIPFDPTVTQSGEKSFEQMESGGMGLSIIRQSVLSMNYERREGRNELALRFLLQSRVS